MKFVRYRHCWAWGYNDWEYAENIGYNLENSDDCEYVRDLMRENEWSDKYRGVDIEGVETPPKEWIEAQLKRITNRIKYDTIRLETYNALLETNYKTDER